MKQKTHYGLIPGCGKKPSLFKPGAEKLISTFKIDPQITATDLSTEDSVRYRVLVTGYHITTGYRMGDGVGECSSNEDKYKWRKAICQGEFDETPQDRRREKWGVDYSTKAEYKIKQVRTNPADQANTILKMAKKRALIDFCLTALGCSDVFTQDLEDIPREILDQGSSQPVAQETQPAQQAQQPQSNYQQEPPQQPGGATKARVQIQGVKVLKQGNKKNGEPYTMYGVVTDRGTLQTFSETIAQKARANTEAVILWAEEMNGRFKNLVIKSYEVAE